ncbi:hypothetical protein MAR_018963, partial [Mya arenaria]
FIDGCEFVYIDIGVWCESKHNNSINSAIDHYFKTGEEDSGYKCLCIETAPYFYNDACIV